MRINISGLKQRVGDHRREKLTASVPPVSIGGDEVRFEGPVKVTADLYNTGQAIQANVKLQAEAELHCSRCLKPFRMPLTAEYQEDFRPEGPPPSARQQAEPAPRKGRKPAPAPAPEIDAGDDEEKVFTPYSGDEIDLTQGVEENLFLAIPMKPLCQPACKGLCPECGHDLNEGSCDCSGLVTDPRLFVLKELLDKQGNKH